MPLTAKEVRDRARHLRLLLLDVDGVLTDGIVSIRSSGGEAKNFSIRDGAAMVWAERAGLEVGLLSGRPSEATSRRAAELGLKIVSQSGPDKRQGFLNILTTRGCATHEVGYMGDDLLDIPILSQVGLSAAPADAVPEVLERVHWVSAAPGGHGAVREFIATILRAQDKWDDVVGTFLT